MESVIIQTYVLTLHDDLIRKRITLRKHARTIYDNFTAVKMTIFRWKIVFVFFLIFAQNTDCGYTLEPPQRGVSNEYPQWVF